MTPNELQVTDGAVLKKRIHELEISERHLLNQIEILDSSRQVAYDTSRADKRLAHELQLEARRLQLSEKALLERVSQLEADEIKLRRKFVEFEQHRGERKKETKDSWTVSDEPGVIRRDASVQTIQQVSASILSSDADSGSALISALAAASAVGDIMSDGTVSSGATINNILSTSEEGEGDATNKVSKSPESAQPVSKDSLSSTQVAEATVDVNRIERELETANEELKRLRNQLLTFSSAAQTRTKTVILKEAEQQTDVCDSDNSLPNREQSEMIESLQVDKDRLVNNLTETKLQLSDRVKEIELLKEQVSTFKEYKEEREMSDASSDETAKILKETLQKREDELDRMRAQLNDSENKLRDLNLELENIRKAGSQGTENLNQKFEPKVTPSVLKDSEIVATSKTTGENSDAKDKVNSSSNDVRTDAGVTDKLKIFFGSLLPSNSDKKSVPSQEPNADKEEAIAVEAKPTVEDKEHKEVEQLDVGRSNLEQELNELRRIINDQKQGGAATDVTGAVASKEDKNDDDILIEELSSKLEETLQENKLLRSQINDQERNLHVLQEEIRSLESEKAAFHKTDLPTSHALKRRKWQSSEHRLTRQQGEVDEAAYNFSQNANKNLSPPSNVTSATMNETTQTDKINETAEKRSRGETLDQSVQTITEGIHDQVDTTANETSELEKLKQLVEKKDSECRQLRILLEERDKDMVNLMSDLCKLQVDGSVPLATTVSQGVQTISTDDLQTAIQQTKSLSISVTTQTELSHEITLLQRAKLPSIASTSVQTDTLPELSKHQHSTPPSISSAQTDLLSELFKYRQDVPTLAISAETQTDFSSELLKYKQDVPQPTSSASTQTEDKQDVTFWSKLFGPRTTTNDVSKEDESRDAPAAEVNKEQEEQKKMMMNDFSALQQKYINTCEEKENEIENYLKMEIDLRNKLAEKDKNILLLQNQLHELRIQNEEGLPGSTSKIVDNSDVGTQCEAVITSYTPKYDIGIQYDSTFSQTCDKSTQSDNSLSPSSVTTVSEHSDTPLKTDKNETNLLSHLSQQPAQDEPASVAAVLAEVPLAMYQQLESQFKFLRVEYDQLSKYTLKNSAAIQRYKQEISKLRRWLRERDTQIIQLSAELNDCQLLSDMIDSIKRDRSATDVKQVMRDNKIINGAKTTVSGSAEVAYSLPPNGLTSTGPAYNIIHQKATREPALPSNTLASNQTIQATIPVGLHPRIGITESYVISNPKVNHYTNTHSRNINHYTNNQYLTASKPGNQYIMSSASSQYITSTAGPGSQYITSTAGPGSQYVTSTRRMSTTSTDDYTEYARAMYSVLMLSQQA